MKLKLDKSIFSVNSSPEAILHLVQKASLTCKIKPVTLHNFVATKAVLWENFQGALPAPNHDK